MYRIRSYNKSVGKTMYFQYYGDTHGFTFVVDAATTFDNVDDATEAFDRAVRGLTGNSDCFVEMEFSQIPDHWKVVWNEVSTPIFELQRL